MAAERNESEVLAIAACHAAARYGFHPRRVVVFTERDEVGIELQLSVGFQFQAAEVAIELKGKSGDGPQAKK